MVTKMKFTVDRIEGEFAVVITDDGKRFDVPAGLFADLKEGNVYDLRLDEGEMKSRKARIEKLADEIWE